MDIFVSPAGTLKCSGREYRCALGKNGITDDKSEGDGATPKGSFSMREVLYRADKIETPVTPLPVSAIQENDGWCDDPNDSRYNKRVVLPYPARHEKLWRDDDIYDIVVPLGYNDAPAIPGKGSAIFLHVARPDYSPTEGCIALSQENLLHILTSVSAETKLLIG